jgi:glycine/serine hydroxymethyltransferase
MAQVASFFDRAIGAKDDADALAKVRREVAELCARYPMPH